MEDHTYFIVEKGTPAPGHRTPLKKRKRDTGKRDRDRRRQKTRVNIGVAFPRWKSLMRDTGLHTDADVARFLLDSYDGGPAAPTPTKRQHSQVTTPVLSTSGVSSGTDSSRDHVSVKEMTFIEPLNVVFDWADERFSPTHSRHDVEKGDGSDGEFLPPVTMRSRCVRDAGWRQARCPTRTRARVWLQRQECSPLHHPCGTEKTNIKKNAEDIECLFQVDADSCCGFFCLFLANVILINSARACVHLFISFSVKSDQNLP